MNGKIVRSGGILVCGLLVAASWFSCADRGLVDADSGQQLVMGTFVHVVVVANDSTTAKKGVAAALEEVRRVDELMSDYKSDSDIGRANAEAAEHPVQVSDSTYEVLQRSVEFSKLSDGAFDITVGPLVALFRAEKKTGVVPTEEQIAQAKAKVGFEKLELDDRQKTVRFAVEGMRLDLGAIAKGYAVDKAIEAAQRCGAIGAMVDLGGNVKCFGSPPKGRDHWLIGVEDPNSAVEGVGGGSLLFTLKITDAAMATSGDYQQFVVVAGKRYSHILNPQTGASAEGLSSVTIIADSATDADALSTAVSVMGPQKGLALIEKLPGTEAILVGSGPKYEITKTSGVDRYIK
ncbi:MAG TPA: FAD:protein FMN transferase [Sedimentisphaerales bacterium]|nr:FAD:protein FMN transferase [Sedimentisphaerales bacterium]